MNRQTHVRLGIMININVLTYFWGGDLKQIYQANISSKKTRKGISVRFLLASSNTRNLAHRYHKIPFNCNSQNCPKTRSSTKGEFANV